MFDIPLIRPRFWLRKSALRLLLSNPLPDFLGSRKIRKIWDRVYTWEFPDKSGYFSQSGQDIFIYNLPKQHKEKGFFVDIGAYDGITFSNTYFFEKNLGWEGLCVEAAPEAFISLKNNRRCGCIEGYASIHKGTVLFDVSRGMGNRSVKERDPSKNDKSLIKVKCVDIREALTKRNVKKIDYLSIDTEGGELELFKHITGGGFSINVVSLEQNDDYRMMDSELRKRGFRFLSKIGADRIYRFTCKNRP